MPFDFLLDYLPAKVVIKPAIGMYYIYFEGKIVLVFRQVGKNPQHNGIGSLPAEKIFLSDDEDL